MLQSTGWDAVHGSQESCTAEEQQYGTPKSPIYSSPPFSPGNHKIENQTLKSSMEGELSSNPSHPLQWAPLGSTQNWALAFPTGLNRQGRSVAPRRPVRASAEPHRTRPVAAPRKRIMVGNSQQGGTSEAGALR